MKLKSILASVAIVATAALSTTACADLGDYGYVGPAYVVGTYTCTNPASGQIDYCVEYNDGSSQLVPFSIYSTVAYGSVLSFTNYRWTVARSSYYSARRAPDVYHVTYRAYNTRSYRSYTSSTSYSGMSTRRNGKVSYYSYKSNTSYRPSSFSSSRSSFSSRR